MQMSALWHWSFACASFVIVKWTTENIASFITSFGSKIVSLHVSPIPCLARLSYLSFDFLIRLLLHSVLRPPKPDVNPDGIGPWLVR